MTDDIQRRRAIGVEVQPDGRVHARVWAPYARDADVSVLLEKPTAADHGAAAIPLYREEAGYFAGYLPGAVPGDRYRFQFGEVGEPYADPASRFQPEGVHGPSQIVDATAYSWQVDEWTVADFRHWVIYELHVGTFTPEGNFSSIIPHLPYLKDLGVTAIELMPVNQFPGDRNWGYDGVFPFAPQHSYGGPDELKTLVDAAHGAGLTVILDVVYNHFGPEGNVVHHYGPYFTDRYRTPWGDAINFDGPGSDEVRAFFIENALMWLEEYRIDGFRLDAVHQIYDAHGQPFLAELASAVHARAAELGRTVVLIAESDLNDTKLILRQDQGGYGLDAQWADDFCHALETQLVGDESPYLSDFGDFSAMATALEQAFVYTGQHSQLRGRRFGRNPAPAQRDQFVVFLQNHDQVGNRPGGARLGHHISFAQRKLGAATVLLSPFVPLIFMGEEYGEPNPFLYITHHGDTDLIEGVRAGRREEFSHWNWDTDDAAPDPQDIATLERSRVQVGLHAADHDDAAEHRALHDFYREALALRHGLPALTDPASTRSMSAHEDERVIVIHTMGRNDSDELLTVLAFADEPVTVALPVNEGTWQKRLDAGDARFLGEASAPETLAAGDLSLFHVPAHAAFLYERTA